ncbi:hypothetical protein KKE60_07880 [Patescibacteria group bacterium]|nr:hypothetical protein [Patescibacteria group bacterium]
MGYFNIKLNDYFTEKFKELKTLLKCQTNDAVVENLIMIASNHFQQKLFKSPKQSNKNNKTLKTEEKKE